MLEWPGDPQNIRQVLIPRLETMTLFGKKNKTRLCRCNQVKGLEMKRMFWIIQAGPKSSDGCFTRSRLRDTGDREETPSRGDGHVENADPAAMRPPAIGHRGHQKLEEVKGPSPGASGGVQPGRLALGTSGLQDGERMSAVLSHQPQEAAGTHLSVPWGAAGWMPPQGVTRHPDTHSSLPRLAVCHPSCCP